MENEVEEAVPLQPDPEPADTVRTSINIINGGGWGGIKTLDLLIYSADGLMPLEKKVSIDGSGGDMEVYTTSGAKEFVAVANSSQRLDLKILDRFDTMQSLMFSYNDEDIDFPVMTGHTRIVAGEGGEVTVRPFLCRVKIEAVSNSMDNWVLMEEPEVYLSEVNTEAGILQEKDFRPVATQEEGPWAALPFDVGFYTQHPGTVLHCYPNETPERLFGGCRTSLTFCCKVEGEDYSATVPLPPLGRAGTASVKVEMSEDRDIKVRISTSEEEACRMKPGVAGGNAQIAPGASQHH